MRTGYSELVKTRVYGERWETVNSIGEGGQGHVFEVRDLRNPLSGHYALKRLKNPNRIERFKAEVDALRKLDHPNIVKLIDYFLPDSCIGTSAPAFLVMPFAKHGNLTTRVRALKASLARLIHRIAAIP